MRRTERAGRHASDRQIQLAALLLTTVISLTFLIYHPRHPEFASSRQHADLRRELHVGFEAIQLQARDSRMLDPPTPSQPMLLSMPLYVPSNRSAHRSVVLQGDLSLAIPKKRTASASPKITAKAQVVWRAGSWISRVGSRGALPYNHMAMIEQLPNNKLVAVWQASEEGEGTPDQHLRIAYSKDSDGRSWGESYKLDIEKGSKFPVWSPVLQWSDHDAQPNEGTLWLIYTMSTEHCRAPGRRDVW
mmetsp:Transcript_8770/g.16552  ORF Transcript_8770/g.16552 Transcript_8770/m.16552 type:complete len:246 (+) Transcript_8770:206-943(+)